jgi:hypothetical protein
MGDWLRDLEHCFRQVRKVAGCLDQLGLIDCDMRTRGHGAAVIWQVAVLGVALTACATPTPSPSASPSPLPSASLQANQLLLRADAYESVLTLRDEVGVVTGMVSGAPSIPVQTVEPYALTNPEGDLSKLELSWITNPCQRAPILTVSGHAPELTLILERGVFPDCEQMGITWGVTLELSESIDHSKVTVVIVGRS